MKPLEDMTPEEKEQAIQKAVRTALDDLNHSYATLQGFRLYVISRKYGTEPLYAVEGKQGLFYKDFDQDGDYVLKPLRNMRVIYDSTGYKFYYRKEAWL